MSFLSSADLLKLIGTPKCQQFTIKGPSYQRFVYTIGQDDRLSGQDDHHSDQSTRVIPNVACSERLSIKLTRSVRLSIKLGYGTRR